MKKNLIFIFSFVLLAFTGCSSDDDGPKGAAVSVAFSVPSLNLTDATTPVQVLFSEPTPAAGNVKIGYTTTAATYGTDFTTLPAAQQNTITVPFEAGVTSVGFAFNKIIAATGSQVKNVVFTITGTSFGNTVITGNKTLQANFNETASLGQALAAEVGGPTQPNQVYVDLSTGTMTKVARVSWDLGFYSGAEFRVALNSSVKMSAKQLETTNIDEVQVEDPSMIINQGSGSVSQIDQPAGLISGTAITEVSANDVDNKVYLINMGNNPATTAPAPGLEGSAGGSQRGWKKVRILKSGNDYKIQYADLASTTHEEKIITKQSAYNFAFFSFATNNTVSVEPQKNQWDLNFTTFTNLAGPTTPYFFPDFVVSNLKGSTKAYMVTISGSVTYDNFAAANVDAAKFTEDQRNIGSNWRSTSVTGPDGNPVSQFVLKTDRFFVIKDVAGNVYKLRFTGGANAGGERGFPTFQYAKVQ